MITPEIISYIKTERAKNTPESLIKSNLLANGWSETDIINAMSATDLSTVPKPLISDKDIKNFKKKTIWKNFYILLCVDFLMIIGVKLFFGIWGLFGVSPVSIIVRLMIIYSLANFTARGASSEDSTPKTILRVIGTVLMAIIIAAGIFFVGCLFLLSSYH